MALKAKQPEEVKATKPKFFISGEAKVGKTTFALQFPKPYLIDTEGGAVREQYVTALKKSGGAYFGKEEGSQDFDTVNNEVKELAKSKHPYQTLIIDSFSYLFLLKAAEAEESIGSEYGKDKKEAIKPTRRLMGLLEKLDMTTILVCHAKDKWEKKPGSKDRELVGTTFDGWDKLEYIYDLWLEILPQGRAMMVRGSRLNQFPKGDSFPCSYEKFSQLYGKDIIEKEAVPVIFATDEQLKRVVQLVDALKVPESQIDKWFISFNVEEWKEMSKEQIQKCIDLMEKKIMELSMVKK